MSNRGRFAYSDLEMYCNDKGFILTGQSLKYLCAILNSTLVTWMIRNTGLTTGMGLTQWKKFVVERIPIPKIAAEEQNPLLKLVDEILDAKAADPDADTSELEEDIDWLVYDLYGLSDEETAEVADFFWEGPLGEEEEDEALARAMDEALQEAKAEGFVSREEIMNILLAPDEC